MKAVVGLGNPGPEYADTRHNLGFRVAERFAARHGVRRFHSEGPMLLARLRLAGDEVLVVKPVTYMNRSGEAVRELARRHALKADDLVVAHDDLDLELGDVRVKRGGGHGGHNGLRSILEETGEEFVRVRLGIRRPEPGLDAAEWVLQPFSEEERAPVEGMLARGEEAVELVLRLGPERAMNQFNRRTRGSPAAAGEAGPA